MRHQAVTVFDEYVPIGTAYTSAQFNPLLASSDQLALHAIVDNAAGAGTLDIFIETSGDGRNWIQRNDQSTSGTINPTGEFHFVTASATTQQLMYADPCATVTPAAATFANPGGSPKPVTNSPLLAFVRLRVVVGGNGCHVKIHATLRGPR